MSDQNPHVLFENMADAQAYIQDVRSHYRAEQGEYAGRRSPDQAAIAEMAADEARMIVDGTMVGMLAVGGIIGTGRVGAVTESDLLPGYEDTEFGGQTWGKYRGEFGRLLSGFGVMTSRLNRDGYDVPSYMELGEEDRSKAASELFSDFLTHNALRTGVDTASLRGSKRVHNDEGGIDVVMIDPDKAETIHTVQRNLRTRGYTSGNATHIAGKMSPAEYIDLRRDFPDIDKDKFDNDAAYYQNARKEFESRG